MISVMIIFLKAISNYFLQATTVFITIFAKVAFNHHLHSQLVIFFSFLGVSDHLKARKQKKNVDFDTHTTFFFTPTLNESYGFIVFRQKDWERKYTPQWKLQYILDSYLSLKINGKEVTGKKTHSAGQWEKIYKNVSVLSGNDIQEVKVASFIPDIKIKNLEYKNLLNKPEYVNGVWRESKKE